MALKLQSYGEIQIHILLLLLLYLFLHHGGNVFAVTCLFVCFVCLFAETYRWIVANCMPYDKKLLDRYFGWYKHIVGKSLVIYYTLRGSWQIYCGKCKYCKKNLAVGKFQVEVHSLPWWIFALVWELFAVASTIMSRLSWPCVDDTVAMQAHFMLVMRSVRSMVQVFKASRSRNYRKCWYSAVSISY